MADREKVIKGLERCSNGNPSCEGCPYDIHISKCLFLLHDDSLELLKEQDERIKQLESMNVTATGNATAIGTVKGGLVIKKQTANEIMNIKHVEVMNL